MNEEELKFVDNKLFVYTPIPQYGDGICKRQLVMTKDIFQECYQRWIKPQENEHCDKEHGQLAEWLKDYKRLKNQELCEYCKIEDIKEEIKAQIINTGKIYIEKTWWNGALQKCCEIIDKHISGDGKE